MNMGHLNKNDEAHQAILKLFDLSKNNLLLDDVSCVIKKKIGQAAGRLYIFEQCLAFYSKIFGSVTKVVIPISDILFIKKAKSLGLLQNAVKVYTVGDNKYFFKRMSNRDQTFDMIVKLWQELSPHAKDPNNPYLKEQNGVEGSQADNYNYESHPLNGSVGKKDLPRGRKNGSDPMEDLGTIKERSNSVDIIQGEMRRSMSQEGRLFNEDNDTPLFKECQSPLKNKEEEKQNELKITQIDKKNFHSVDTLAQNLNSNILSDNQSINSQQPSFKEPTDDELYKELSSKYPLQPKHQEIGRYILPIGLDQYFKLFQEKDGKFSNDKFCIERGDKVLSLTDWSDEVQPDQKEAWGLQAKKQKSTHMINQVKDNPFVKQSDTTKISTLMEQSDRHLNIRIFNIVKDVPYCDCFNVEENWVIASVGPESKKIALRLSIQTLFKKSTMFKGKIESGSLQSSKKNFQSWCEWASGKISGYLKENQNEIVKEEVAVKQMKQSDQQQQVQSKINFIENHFQNDQGKKEQIQNINLNNQDNTAIEQLKQEYNELKKEIQNFKDLKQEMSQLSFKVEQQQKKIGMLTIFAFVQFALLLLFIRSAMRSI